MARELVVETYLAPCNRPLYEFIARELGGRLRTGRDWRDAARADVAFVCSPPVIWLGGAVEPIGAPILADARFGGRPLYSSEVIVPRDSRYGSLRDLRGARWAVNEPGSWSGYWVTLAQVGSWDYFGEVVLAGFHQKAIRMVAEGRVDASAIDSHVLAVELRDNPGLGERIRVIDSLGPAPSQPVVVRADLAPAIKKELQERLLALRDRTLSKYFVERFAAAPDYSLIATFVGATPPAGSSAVS